MPAKPAPDIEAFLARWGEGDGGQERANYALFLAELCDVLDVPRPDQASHDAATNAYAFERAVTFREPDGSTARGRIDLYKRGSFVLEAKQSRRPGGAKAVPEQGDLLLAEEPEPAPRGKRNASRAWDALMMNARRAGGRLCQGLALVRGLASLPIVCDVGHCFEIYADFSGQGKNYAQFPDRQGFRIYLEDLRSDDIRARLRLIWLDPHKLDPTKIAAKATREVAQRLASVSKRLEEAKGKDGKNLHDPEAVALFLMRCLFTMFAEDVELLPKGSFRDVLKKCVDNPSLFPRLVGQLWEAMDTGGFSFALERDIKNQRLSLQESNRLRLAARRDWRTVRGGESRLETGGARDLRNALGASAKPHQAARARRAVHAARLCGAACRRDRAGAVKSRMGKCSGDGGKQAKRGPFKGREAGKQAFTRALRD